MKVLIPVSPGGERTTEPQYTTTEWDQLSPKARTKAQKDIRKANSGVCFEFNHDEAKRIIDKVGFNNGPFILSDDPNLLGIRTKTYVDEDHEVMIQFLGIFRQDGTHPVPKSNLIHTSYPQQLIDHLDQILLTVSRPVSQ